MMRLLKRFSNIIVSVMGLNTNNPLFFCLETKAFNDMQNYYDNENISCNNFDDDITVHPV